MGSVYEAEHTILGRKAALKTLLPELAGDDDFPGPLHRRITDRCRSRPPEHHPHLRRR